MRVLLAGATGALGTPLTRMLLARGHEVIGITRSPSGAERLAAAGARAVRADVMDCPALLRAVHGVVADAVVHQLTALRRVPMRYRDLAPTNALRTTGTANLLDAAESVGATRFVTQSIVFGYGLRDHGERMLTEADPFGVPVGNRLDEMLSALVIAEQQPMQRPGMAGIALRYGGFYGPGAATGQLIDLLRKRRFALPRHAGTVPFIFIDDAASATVAALEQGRGGQAYNVVDDTSVPLAEFCDALARAAGLPRPMRVPDVVLRAVPYAHAAMTMSMRVSNAKARSELGWRPAYPSYREGIAAVVAALGSAPGIVGDRT